MQAAMCATWCCTATVGTPSACGDPRRMIVGVEIAADQPRRGVVQTLHVVERPAIGIARLRRIEIAEMLAEDDAGFGAQRHGRLEVAADGEDARRNARSRQSPARSPRARRSTIGRPATTRTTESSTGRTIGRS